MSTAVLPEDGDAREREIRHRVGDWLQRRLADVEPVTSETVAEATELPEEAVQRELTRLVADVQTPLAERSGAYVFDGDEN